MKEIGGNTLNSCQCLIVLNLRENEGSEGRNERSNKTDGEERETELKLLSLGMRVRQHTDDRLVSRCECEQPFRPPPGQVTHTSRRKAHLSALSVTLPPQRRTSWTLLPRGDWLLLAAGIGWPLPSEPQGAPSSACLAQQFPLTPSLCIIGRYVAAGTGGETLRSFRFPYREQNTDRSK